MAAPRPVNPEAPFDPSRAPVIEGFNPTVYANPETFKDKFIRKTRENPVVPIGKCAVGTEDRDSGLGSWRGKNEIGGRPTMSWVWEGERTGD